MRESITIDYNGLNFPIAKEDYKKLSEKNIEIIREYDKFNKRSGFTETTRYNNIQHVTLLVKHFKKPLEEITREELTNYVDNLDINNLSKGQYVMQFSKFFKWLYQEEKPGVIKDLIVPKVSKVTKKFSDMLTEEEIQKLIDVCESVHHKAFVSVLYDSACRISELINLKIGDVVCNNGQWVISVEGKTGIRNIPLTLSTRYLAPWFNEFHPNRNNPEVPLFLSQAPRLKYKKIKDRQVSICGAWFILDQCRQIAGIKKKCNPHILRHSRLSWLAEHGINESELRDFAGWEKDSTMPAVYIHTNPDNLSNKIKQIQGLKVPKKPVGSKLIAVICPRCKAENDVSSQYCRQCWLPLKQQIAFKEMMIVEFLRSELYKSDKSQLEEFDIEFLAEKLNQLLHDQHEEGRKQVKIV